MNPQAINVVEFDFQTRKERAIGVEEVCAACAAGRSCWVDIDVTQAADPTAALAALGIDPQAIKAALGDALSGRCDIYDECFHIEMSVPSLSDGRLQLANVDMILGDHFLVTLRRGPVAFIEETRRGYRAFFAKFAESLGFLLFDLWEHLIDTYREMLVRLEDKVEAVQEEILGDIDDSIFNRVNDITHSLLLLRKNVLANREVLEQLAIRKSAFVSPTTQPYLANMVGTLDRLGDDLTTEREILAELLTLYLGIVSHRTNRVVNRLTVISVIFLPLSFLVGVYGMNFEGIPEYHWPFGYQYFWGLVLAISGGLLGLMKWKRWL
jgi:magnesium transporter